MHSVGDSVLSCDTNNVFDGIVNIYIYRKKCKKLVILRYIGEIKIDT